MSYFTRFAAGEDRKFAVLAGWLIIVFLMGGGARDDILSLLVLRPLSAVVLACGLYKISRDDVARYRSLFLFFGAIVVLVVGALVPLPPFVWHQLPHHDLIERIDRAAGIGEIWRPLSIAPPRTWNALFALMVPASVIVLAVRLDRDQLKRLVPLVLGLALVSVLLGILQITGSGAGLYLYRIHNAGAADGLFANRNHQAAFLACMLPLLALFASARDLEEGAQRFRFVASGICALLLVAVLLILGSRAGFALGLAALAASTLVYRRQAPAASRKKRGRGARGFNFDNRWIVGGFAAGVVALGASSVLAARAESLNRLFGSTTATEVRAETFRPVVDLAWSFLPFGSGAGTFVEAFYLVEPRSFLSPTYLNHAHLDYLEWAVTGGLPTLVLIAVGLVILVVELVRSFVRRSIQEPGVQLARAGALVVVLLAAASGVDYPVRTPSLSALIALAAVWMFQSKGRGEAGPKQVKAGNR